MHASRKSSNIIRTVQLQLFGNTLGFTLYPKWVWGDPDEVRDPAVDAEKAFVTMHWQQTTAGRKGSHIVQVDVWSRIKAQTDADDDPFGNRATQIADALEDTFTGDSFCFPILDFETLPSNPPDTGEKLMCYTAQGDYGLPASRDNLGIEGGRWRESLVFRFVMFKDVADQSDRYLT